MIRTFWKLASPFVWAANRLGLCSYKWVNVCIGARNPESFDALWQYEWYGTPIPALPDFVVLCGIGYDAAASEGTVTFKDDFTKSRITFDRDSARMWRVELSGREPPAVHVVAAYRWVDAVFGGTFEERVYV